MKVIRIIDRASGNESVGTMWEETEIFDSEQKIIDLFKNSEYDYIKLSIPKKEFEKHQAEQDKKRGLAF